LNPAEAAEFLRANGSAAVSDNPGRFESIQRLVQKMIDGVNERLSSSESIRKFAILERDFEIEKDEVTPTGKLKREVVTANHRNLIDSLYLTQRSTITRMTML